VPRSTPFHFLRWLLLLPIPALWCLVHFLGWLDFLEERAIDWRFLFRGEIDAPVKIVYVDIDSRSITDIGNQPWDRAYYAEVSDALLKAGKARAVGIDILFSDKGKSELTDEARFHAGTERLRRVLDTQPPAPVVVAATYAAAEDRDINHQRIVRELPGATTPIEEALPPELPTFSYGNFRVNPPLVGLIDTIEGGTRRVPLFARTPGRTYFHMGIELARLYWNMPSDAVTIYPDRLELARPGGDVLARVPLQGGRDLEVNWFSRWDSERNPRVSFSLVLVAAQMLASDQADEREAAATFFQRFEDAIVLIGPVDPLLHDVAPTSFDDRPVPQVGIHGNVLKTIVSGKYLQRLPGVGEAGLIVALTLAAGAMAVATGRRGVWLRTGAVLLLVAYVALAFFIFARAHLVLPLIAPLGAAFTTSFAAIAWQLVVEEKKRSRIKGMFGTYVSPELVDRMVEAGEEPKLGGVEARITAYFSDIEGFSSFSESLPPDQLVELMNEYLTACTDIVTAQGGTLDKYVGDAVVAMFGAPVEFPDHAYRACVASQVVQQKLDELRKKWAADGKWPATVGRMRTRIGLNSGPAVVGNMGSLTRFNYTMMGDTVNLAARLESAARSYGVDTLVTEATKHAAELAGDRCVFRYLDRIVVKGRTEPVAIYEIVGLKETLSSTTRECLALFAEAMALYLKQDWANARAGFERASRLEPWQPDEFHPINPSLLYRERCEAMAANPPGEGWNGVFVMKTK
jgi:Adenylate cyclase, family 3 (some proteins contain HAMP domain)